MNKLIKPFDMRRAYMDENDLFELGTQATEARVFRDPEKVTKPLEVVIMHAPNWDMDKYVDFRKLADAWDCFVSAQKDLDPKITNLVSKNFHKLLAD